MGVVDNALTSSIRESGDLLPGCIHMVAPLELLRALDLECTGETATGCTIRAFCDLEGGMTDMTQLSTAVPPNRLVDWSQNKPTPRIVRHVT